MSEGAVRMGVVGVGSLGQWHARIYSELPGVELVGVYDLNAARAEEIARRYRTRAVSDMADLAARVDAASIVVPADKHYEAAQPFLDRGVHLLVEKPIAANTADAEAMAAAAERKQLVLQVGHVERFNPAVMALEKVITRPVFIEVHRLHPFFERGTDVDVILDLMIHDLDIILKFVRSPLTSVEAVGVPVLSDKIDISNVRLSFASGCIANVTASRISAKTMQKLRFFGPEGYHAVDTRKREILSLGRAAGPDGKQQIVQNNIDVGDHDPLEEEVRSFVACVRTRSTPIVSGEEGRRSLALAEEILRKMKTHEDLPL